MRSLLGSIVDRVLQALVRRVRDHSPLELRTSPATKLAIAQHVYPGKHPDYFSAAPVAMVRLAGRKGYRLGGANRYGFNLILVKRGLHEDCAPEVNLESVLTHPRYWARLDRFKAIKDWKYETPD